MTDAESVIADIGFAPRDHIIRDGEVIGTFVDVNGNPIVRDKREIPRSGPISLSDMGQYLLGQNKMWMDNGYLKDLIQDPSQTRRLSQYYGATWGSPQTTIQQGAGGMTVYKWDWRYDGDPNTSGAGFSTSGPWGGTTHTAELKNNYRMSGPGAYSGNGYFLGGSGKSYRLTFDFSGYSKTNSQHDSYMGVAVFGYRDGYLNGTRTERLKFENFNPTNSQSGTRSYEILGSDSYKHMVVNFTWWCPGWTGVEQGIACSISNAKVTRLN